MNNYDNSQVRRQDRLLDEERAEELLAEAEYGILSMVEQRDGKTAGYGIPINFIWDGGTTVYIHCAPDGHKLKCLDSCAEVSLTVVGRTNVVPNKFTTGYESIVVRGRIERGLPAEERHHALELLLDKFSPNDKTVGLKYAEKSFYRTEILKLHIQSISGKAKHVQ